MAQRLELRQCTFRQPVDFGDSTFTGPVVFEGGAFESRLTLSRSVFKLDLRFSTTCRSAADFDDCVFEKRCKFLSEFHGVVNFNGSTFHEAAEFVGGWMHSSPGTLSQRDPPARYVFNDGVHLQLIDFRRPERVQFRMVDLSRAFTLDTDFRKVRFYDIKWYQPILRRRGLYVEAWAKEGMVLQRFGPMLEANYRNIRSALEENKDFRGATDFYVGEMEARRRQLPLSRRYLLSIEWVYWLLSLYGASPLRASGALVGVLVLYGMFSGCALGTGCYSLSGGCHLDSDLVVRSLSLVEISKAPSGPELHGWWRFGEIVFRIFAVIQIALLALALRNRIKRT